jgi:prephenate dehydrogenase
VAAIQRVAILGLGLIGGSLGMALKRSGFASEVAGWDAGWETRPASRAVCLERGAVDEAADSPEAAVAGADLVVLAVPVDAVIPLLDRVAPHLEPYAVVTDVGSTKERIVREAEARIAGRFVGGHPMAGSERSGIEAAAADLFEGAPWITCPTNETGRKALGLVERMAAAVGAAPRPCPPGLHDDVAAALSHLPHVLAFGLADTAAARVSGTLRTLAAGSFRDGTRVAQSDPALWTSILVDNAEPVMESLDQFLSWATVLRRAIAAADRESVHRLLAQAHESRAEFETP